MAGSFLVRRVPITLPQKMSKPGLSTSRTLFLLFLSLLLLIGAACVKTTRWRRVGKSREMNISGMALIGHNEQRTTFVVVHDNKSVNDPHAGLVTLGRGNTPHYLTLEWQGEDVPVDLEAITRVPGDSKSFLTLTSAGKIYQVRVDLGNNSIEVIRSFFVPSIPAGSNFEGLSLEMIDGVLLAVWAESGLREKPATLYWSVLDLQNGTFSRVGSAVIKVPYPTANVRHVSDLKIETNGEVLVSSAADPGTDGPFASAIYSIGTLSVAAGQVVVFKQAAPPKQLYSFPDHKVEALESVPGKGGGRAFGSDDESLGGAIYLDW
jgi:hypothetical protein